jgi:hypothetical protein
LISAVYGSFGFAKCEGSSWLGRKSPPASIGGQAKRALNFDGAKGNFPPFCDTDEMLSDKVDYGNCG